MWLIHAFVILSRTTAKDHQHQLSDCLLVPNNESGPSRNFHRTTTISIIIIIVLYIIIINIYIISENTFVVWQNILWRQNLAFPNYIATVVVVNFAIIFHPRSHFFSVDFILILHKYIRPQFTCNQTKRETNWTKQLERCNIGLNDDKRSMFMNGKWHSYEDLCVCVCMYAYDCLLKRNKSY